MFTTKLAPTPKDECLITFKVYDQCRQQDCLRDLPAYTATAPLVPIDPPDTAVSVEIVAASLVITSIGTTKAKSLIRKGYYDVTVTYGFSYDLIFRDSTGVQIGLPVAATSSYTKTVELFGSEGQDVALFSEIFADLQVSGLTAPFSLVEANVLPLPGAKIIYTGATPVQTGVTVMIGLFTIIKLFRFVELVVESKGCCMPEPCSEITDDPCTFFESLDFPFDIFCPPEKSNNSSAGAVKYIPEDI